MRRPTFCTHLRVMNEDPLPDFRKPGSSVDSGFGRVRRMFSPSRLKKCPRMFGAPLEELCGEEVPVPTAVVRMCDYLAEKAPSTEGVFRLSPNHKVVERLRASFDEEGDADLEGIDDVIATSCLLKMFFREMPSPLVPVSLYGQFSKVVKDHGASPKTMASHLSCVVSKLPLTNLTVLHYISKFLQFISLHDDVTKMAPTSLGIVFGPNIFQIDLEGNVMDPTTANKIMTAFIVDCGDIFGDNGRLRRDPTRSPVPFIQMSGKSDDDVQLNKNKAEMESEVMDKVEDMEEIMSKTDERDVINKPIDMEESENKMTEVEDMDDSVIKTEVMNVVIVKPEDEMSDGLVNESLGSVASEATLNKILAHKSPVDDSVPPCKQPNDGHILPSEEELIQKGESSPDSVKEMTPKPATSVVHSVLSSSEESPDTTASEQEFPTRHEWRDDFHEMCRRKERTAHHVRGHKKSGRRSKRRSSQRGDSDDSDGVDAIDFRKHHKQLHRMGHPTALLYTQQSSSTSDDDPISDCVLSPFFNILSKDESSETDGLSPTSPATPRKSAVTPLDLSDNVPPLDLSDTSEPVSCISDEGPSASSWLESVIGQCDDVTLSPRSSMSHTQSPRMDRWGNASPTIYHDENKPVSQEVGYHTKVRQLTKQINSMKRKIKHVEGGFEEKFGYRPSQADRLTHPEMRKYVSELNKARIELKRLKEGGVPSSRQSDGGDAKLEDTLKQVEQRLIEKRKQGNRPEILEDMSPEQIVEEKVAMQKALLYFESIHGRPTTKSEKELMRPLYDRYRLLKRMVIRSGSGKAKDLAPILEHETMDFTQTSPTHRSRSNSCTPLSSLSNTSIGVNISSPVTSEPSYLSDDGEWMKVKENELKRQRKEVLPDLGDNLQELSLTQLLDHQRNIREEKKQLSRKLREFEDEFQRVNGRKVQREDRDSMESTYSQYKQTKAKLRLLDALVTKKETM